MSLLNCHLSLLSDGCPGWYSVPEVWSHLWRSQWFEGQGKTLGWESSGQAEGEKGKTYRWAQGAILIIPASGRLGSGSHWLYMNPQHFYFIHLLTGANEGQEEGGRVASGSVSSPRSSDETQVLPKWSGADKNSPPVPQHAGAVWSHTSTSLLDGAVVFKLVSFVS